MTGMPLWRSRSASTCSEPGRAQLTGYTGDFDNDGRKPEWTWPASYDGTLSGASLDLMRVFARDGRFSPYVLAASACSPRTTRRQATTT